MAEPEGAEAVRAEWVPARSVFDFLPGGQVIPIRHVILMPRGSDPRNLEPRGPVTWPHRDVAARVPGLDPEGEVLVARQRSTLAIYDWRATPRTRDPQTL